jgi:hypothetical protein
MATLALSVAGQFVGGALGGPIGATIGRALGALAGSAIDQSLFGEQPAATAHSDIRLQGASEGGTVARLYGWGRLTGNIIWATELEEISSESRGAKATSSSDETELVVSFAVALCEGEVAHQGRIWADGQLLDTSSLTLRFYRGTETQTPDSLIAAKQGDGNAPAYRGLCYIVFERLPLGEFGNRIPQISVELCRVVGELEPDIRSVALIPGATEFGYDPTPRVRIVRKGTTETENSHQTAGQSDFTVSIDELVALCPNLEHVELVVAWFGDDLRAGECRVRPKVESASRKVKGTEWQVAGLDRADAEMVSEVDGGPAYGGTPSDEAVRAAIADLKARGLAVTLYPMLMLDIPPGNAVGQPAYPWRGRIAGTDGATAAAEVASFMGTTTGWGYRRFIRHYAELASEEGCEGLIVGSEMVGLNRLRDAEGGFPYVAAMIALVEDVAALAPGVDLVYAADWSEYSGFQPEEAPGDIIYPLDALFAHAAIAAVGIDNYLPLADWRDGEDHADFALWDGPEALDYLAANVAGGELHDFYYASAADRRDGVRTPIADSAHGEPWVWRAKDIANWWGRRHYPRVGGVRSGTPSAWQAEMKPIWFTEIGCAAVDKGANQPNVFYDAKSAESGRPYFSSGAPDALGQRQFLRAHAAHWAGTANPISGVYGGPMVDRSRISFWAWDARPYPAFPSLEDVWSDAANYPTGHWLNGRLGGFASDEVLAALAADYGVALAEAAAAGPLISGLVVETLGSGRDALEPILAATGLEIADGDAGLRIARPAARRVVVVDEPVAGDGPLTIRKRGDAREKPGRLSFTSLDRLGDYQTQSVLAQLPDGARLDGLALPLVLDADAARQVAEAILVAKAEGDDTIALTLPPSFLALEPGDVIALPGLAEGPFVVTEIRDGLAREIAGRALPPPTRALVLGGGGKRRSAVPDAGAVPELLLVPLPPLPETPEIAWLAIGAYASPWPGTIELRAAESGEVLAQLNRAAAMGEVLTPLGSGPITRWDSSSFEIELYAGHIADGAELPVLSGSNRLAVENDAGGWELLGFRVADLVATRTYRLTGLLRGLAGTDIAMGAISVGNRVLLIDSAVAMRDVPAASLGMERNLVAYAGRADAEGTPAAVTVPTALVAPLPPAHIKARRLPSGDIAMAWTRRSRADNGNWALSDVPLETPTESYRLAIRTGSMIRREVTVTATGWTYSAAQQVADFGGLAPDFTVDVAQVSSVWGPGAPATEDFHA